MSLLGILNVQALLRRRLCGPRRRSHGSCSLLLWIEGQPLLWSRFCVWRRLQNAASFIKYGLAGIRQHKRIVSPIRIANNDGVIAYWESFSRSGRQFWEAWRCLSHLADHKKATQKHDAGDGQSQRDATSPNDENDGQNFFQSYAGAKILCLKLLGFRWNDGRLQKTPCFWVQFREVVAGCLFHTVASSRRLAR